MLNTNNYFSKAASINWDSLPEALSKGNKLVEGASQNNWAAYNSNENIKRVVDAFFQKLNEYLDKNPNSVVATSKSLPTKTVKTAPKAATAKPTPATRNMPAKKAAVEKEEYDSEDVELIDTDVQFIKRYAAMHGKVKSQAQILTLLHSLQKAIIERRIGKDSPYAKEIDMMQKQLISCYEKMGDMAEIKIDSKNLKRYLEIAHSQEGMFSVALLKSYIALNGKRDVKDRSQRLFNRIKKAVEQGKITKSDKYADKLNEAYQTLKNYNDGDSAMLNINKAQLNGLMGILGENLFQKKSLNGYDDDNGMIVSSGELLAMDFQTIGLQGRYKELIGDPSVGFTAMVYGLPKSGKSTMCLDFANYLAANHGKVLYCAIEEGFGYTLKEKIERLKAHHSNLYITDRVPENLNDFHFVFIDSVSKAGMDVNDIDALRKMHPEVSFIFIYHTTKEGKFKGVNEHAHEVDVIVQVEKGKATSTGRFNAGGSMEF
jgi:deoxyadenosine/deoxycytidine kinase